MDLRDLFRTEKLQFNNQFKIYVKEAFQIFYSLQTYEKFKMEIPIIEIGLSAITQNEIDKFDFYSKANTPKIICQNYGIAKNCFYG